MSRFDDGMMLSVAAELAEMGEVIYLDGVEATGVVTDIIDAHTQSAGGRRDLATFTIYLKKEVGEAVEKGTKVEADFRKGRVIRRQDLGGGGWELVCGPVSSWNGRVPGA